MPWEEVTINYYGDTAQQYVPHAGWRADYEKYLRDFAAQAARESGEKASQRIDCTHEGEGSEIAQTSGS